MTPVQAWLVIGVPALVLGVALFVRRSPVRSALGYLVLFGAFAGLAAYHRPSAALFGGLIALLYAAGRGGRMERVDVREDEEGVPDEALHPARRRAPVT